MACTLDLTLWSLSLESGCGNVQPKYKRDITKIMAEFDSSTDLNDSVDRKRPLTAEIVHNIFRFVIIVTID